MKLAIILALAALPAAAAQCAANVNDEFIFSVDFSSGEVGYYTVEGCDGTSPVLQVTRGVTYKFVQADVTNWYHPLGFAYYPDGAHGYLQFAEVPELEEPTPDNCDAFAFQCNPGDGVRQAPLYCVNEVCETLDNWNEGPDAGLDVYEPMFFLPLDQWAENTFRVELTIPADSKTAEFFYFCHIHHGMSGRIEVVDPPADANALLQPFDPSEYYPAQDAYDQQCGTFDASAYQPDAQGDHALCPDMDFICNPKDDIFSSCMRAIDCKMMADMRVTEPENNIALFMLQMIPHHENAVNMAKILLKFGPTEAGWTTGAGESLDIPGLLYAIINTQTAQIADMEAWLEDNGYTADNCPWNPVSRDGDDDDDDDDDDDLEEMAFPLALVAAILALIALLGLVVGYWVGAGTSGARYNVVPNKDVEEAKASD